MTARDDRTDGRAEVPGTTPNRRDRVSAWWAVLQLDLWQDWYAVPGPTGRAMRRELGANLLEAAGEPGGVPGAVRRLGSLRELAREAVVDTGGVRWVRGATCAMVTVAVVLLAQLVLASVYVDGLPRQRTAVGSGSPSAWVAGFCSRSRWSSSSSPGPGVWCGGPSPLDGAARGVRRWCGPSRRCSPSSYRG